MRFLMRVIPLAAAAVALAGCGGGGGSGGDRSAAIADKIGASSCTAESYEIVNRIDASKERLYDCDLHGGTICVAEENGIAQDVTEETKILFANTLGAQKPDCIG